MWYCWGIRFREEERNSLRAYLAVLYANPRMRVFLRGEKVDTKRVLSALYRPRMYRYQARNLKACAQRELQECQKKVVECKFLYRWRLGNAWMNTIQTGYRSQYILIAWILKVIWAWSKYGLCYPRILLASAQRLELIDGGSVCLMIVV